MQKHILFFCILFGPSMNAMEKQTSWPCICVGQMDGNTTSLNSLIAKLSEKYPNIPCIGLSKEDMLSHQSPLIKTIHSQQYLDNIEKHPSIMLSAINNRLLPSLYPHRYSRTYFDPMLKECATTVVATKILIDQLDTKKSPPHYTISLGEGYSFAGHAQGNNGHAYAAIPLAATYALNTEIIKRILIIDENLTKEETIVKDYYQHGNGSIFYSTNTKLSQFFDNKIITLEKMPNETLWKAFNDPDNVLNDMVDHTYIPAQNIRNFINNYHQPINLAFYNINIEDFNDTIKARALSIATLLNKLIPTVFILSGDKNKYKETAYSIINHICQTATLLAQLTSPRKLSTISKSHATSSSSGEDRIDFYANETSSSEADDYNEYYEDNSSEHSFTEEEL